MHLHNARPLGRLIAYRTTINRVWSGLPDSWLWHDLPNRHSLHSASRDSAPDQPQPPQPDYEGDDDYVKAINPIDAEILSGTHDTPVELESEKDEEEEDYSTLSNPWKYLALLVLFVVFPVGAYVYFYRGGREKLRRKMENPGSYEKLPTSQ